MPDHRDAVDRQVAKPLTAKTVSSQRTVSRVAQGAYLEVEYIRNVLSVSGTLKYADSGTA